MRLSLRWRIGVLFVAIILLATGATTGVAIVRESADAREGLLAEDRAMAGGLAARIDDALLSSRRAVEATAGLIDEGRLNPDVDRDFLAALFDPLVAADRDFSALAFVDAAGAPLLVRPPGAIPAGDALADEDGAFADAMAAGQTRFFLDAEGGPRWIVPLPAAPGSYAVVAFVDLARFEEILLAGLREGADGALVAGGGQLVLATNPQLTSEWMAAPWDRLGSGDSTEAPGPGGGADVLVTRHDLEGMPASVVVLGSTAEIAALQARLIRTGVLTGAVVALAGAALAVVVAAYVSRPVAQLRRTTQAMAAGRLDARAAARGAKEFHDLARDFNAMATSLVAQQRVVRESEERYRTLVQNAPIGIYRTTPDGRVLAANPALARMLGYASPEEYMGRNLETGPYDPGYSRREWRERLERDGEIRGLESTWRRRDGSSIVVRESAKVVRDADGGVRFYEGTIEDVTERRRAEQAMKAAQERLESFVANSTDAILIADFDLTVRRVNAAYERTYGWRADEVLGKPVATVPPEKMGELQDALARVRRGEAVAAFETERVRKDGGRVPVSTALTPVKDGRGAVVGFAAIVRDISERKRAETALRESERRFRALSQHAFEGIAIHRDGRLLEANRAFARMFGYTPAELRGMSLLNLVAAKSVEEVERRMAAPKDDPYEIQCRRRDGGTFPVEMMARSIPYEGGTARVTAVRDLSDRRKLERAVEKRRKLEEENRRIEVANRLKSEFLANMSHELRTPLNAILGFSEVMRDGAAGAVTEEQKEYLGDIVTSANHLLGLINDVLDLAKVEAGRIAFRPEAVKLETLFADTAAGLRSLAEPKKLRVSVDVSEEIGEVLIDPSRLKQVLTNYLSNAIKFTPDRGHVWVRALPEGPDRFRVEVEDDGIGIRPHDVQRLFQEFQQLDTGTGKKYGGTGLGLALTKKLVEAQGGEAGVRSTYGKGSTFFAIFPRDIRPSVGDGGRTFPPASGGSARPDPAPRPGHEPHRNLHGPRRTR